MAMLARVQGRYDPDKADILRETLWRATSDSLQRGPRTGRAPGVK